MSIPLNRSNLYRYLMNIVVEVDRLKESPVEHDSKYFGKTGMQELARQLIDEFELAPKTRDTH